MGTGMIWIIFIGIAAVSWLVQMNLQNKFKKYSKIPTGNGMTGSGRGLEDAARQWHLRCDCDAYSRTSDRPL